MWKSTSESGARADGVEVMISTPWPTSKGPSSHQRHAVRSAGASLPAATQRPQRLTRSLSSGRALRVVGFGVVNTDSLKSEDADVHQTPPSKSTSVDRIRVSAAASVDAPKPVLKSKFYGAFALNHRVVLHAIDATPARWRGDAGSSPLDRARTAASSPRNDLVKNYRVHPTLDFHTVVDHRRLPLALVVRVINHRRLPARRIGECVAATA